MSSVIEAVTSGAAGIASGFIGSLGTKIIEGVLKYKDNQFQLDRIRLSIQELRLEQEHELKMADKTVERAKVEGDIKIEHAEVGAFTESQKTLGTLEGALRMVRPAITGYMMLLSTCLTMIVWNKVGGMDGFNPDELLDLLRSTVDTVLFLTATAIAWWFGSRGGNTK